MCFLLHRRPPRSTLTYTLLPSTSLFRSCLEFPMLLGADLVELVGLVHRHGADAVVVDLDLDERIAVVRDRVEPCAIHWFVLQRAFMPDPGATGRRSCPFPPIL